MPTTKSRVIEHLFNQRWDEGGAALRSTGVSLEQVAQAIGDVNPTLPERQQLSERNPANFFKDFIRNLARASANWPQSILEKGYTARQTTGAGDCFEFIPLPEGQVDPFPPQVPVPDSNTRKHQIQSASLPLTSRRLARRDEPWLVQTAVRLRIIETHLTLESQRDIIQIDHLQMSVKLRMAEIDAIFLAIEKQDDGSTREAIVTCEAKTGSDDILITQILTQVRAIFAHPDIDQSVVIPVAIKAINGSEIYFVEFEAVTEDEAEEISALRVASTAIYELVPPVERIDR